MSDGIAIREVGHPYDTGSEGEGGDVARIVRALDGMQVGSSVTICAIPASLAVAWSEDAGTTIRITNNSRRHYLAHPMIAEHEELVVEALLDPDQIRRDQKKPDTKALFYRERNGVLIAVVVKKRTGRGTYNPVVTAFSVRQDLWGRMHAEELLWRRER